LPSSLNQRQERSSVSSSPEPPAKATSHDRAPVLEYVTMPNCRDCSRFEQVLNSVRAEYPAVEVREVPADSERGRRASLERGVLRFPVILLNDEIIAIEKISEDDLRWFLSRAAGE
jgi:glutaredoxin